MPTSLKCATLNYCGVRLARKSLKNSKTLHHGIISRILSELVLDSILLLEGVILLHMGKLKRSADHDAYWEILASLLTILQCNSLNSIG